MSKIQNNKILNNIVFGLLILLILGMGAIAFLPLISHAASGYYGGTAANDDFVSNDAGYNYSNGNSNSSARNPVPAVSYTTPTSSAYRSAGLEVKVRGSGFIPASRVKFDNQYRPTTYVSSINLTATLNPSDFSVPGTHVITVENPGPGGGTSNAIYFTVEQGGAVLGATTSRNPSPTVTSADPKEEFKDLTSNVIYGSGNFMPSSAVQWIMVAILILIIILLARKFFGLEKKYHSTPLKHS